MTPLTVPEARAILVADEALDLSFDVREASGQTLGIEEGDAWCGLVDSAKDRVAVYDATKGLGARTAVFTVLACREGAFWVVQAIEEDVASQGAAMIDAIVDLGRMFDARDQLIAVNPQMAHNRRAPEVYELAVSEGLLVGDLPLGLVRVARIYLGTSPYERRKP